MAIYHFKSQIIKRSAGRSATASAAYRAREKIKDERTSLTFDYRHINPASHCQILAPDNAPSWMYDRAVLWNAVEKAEKRKDSQVAREIMVALPAELSRDDQIKLGINFIQNTYVSKGMVADLAFHDLDRKNPHLHVMLTTRKIDGLGFGNKERDWNPQFVRGQAKGQVLESERQLWQDYTNQALEVAGYSARVDCRSLADRGLERVPQIHLGAKANNLEKKGIRTARGDEHRKISAINREIATLQIQLEIIQQQLRTEKELEKSRISKQQQDLNSELESIREDFSASAGAVNDIVNKFLHYYGTERFELKSYKLALEENNTLVVEAKDDRGVILKINNGSIVVNRLSHSDLEKFQNLDRRVELEVQKIKEQKKARRRRKDIQPEQDRDKSR